MSFTYNIKSECICKSDARIGKDFIFIKDKTYSAEFEFYTNPETNRINGGFRSVKVLDEAGNYRDISKAVFNICFHTKVSLRDDKLKKLMDDE